MPQDREKYGIESASFCMLASLSQSAIHLHGGQHGFLRLPYLISHSPLEKDWLSSLSLVWKIWRKVWWFGLSQVPSQFWMQTHIAIGSPFLYIWCVPRWGRAVIFFHQAAYFGVKYVYRTTLGLKYKETGGALKMLL